MPIHPESRADTNPRGRKGIAIIGATLAALAIVIALVATNSPSGKGTPRRSTSALEPHDRDEGKHPALLSESDADNGFDCGPVVNNSNNGRRHDDGSSYDNHGRDANDAYDDDPYDANDAAYASRRWRADHDVFGYDKSIDAELHDHHAASAGHFLRGGHVQGGSQIVARTYRAPGGTGCYWARRKQCQWRRQ